jgi:hypothetical protein
MVRDILKRVFRRRAEAQQAAKPSASPTHAPENAVAESTRATQQMGHSGLLARRLADGVISHHRPRRPSFLQSRVQGLSSAGRAISQSITRRYMGGLPGALRFLQRASHSVLRRAPLGASRWRSYPGRYAWDDFSPTWLKPRPALDQAEPAPPAPSYDAMTTSIQRVAPRRARRSAARPKVGAGFKPASTKPGAAAPIAQVKRKPLHSLGKTIARVPQTAIKKHVLHRTTAQPVAVWGSRPMRSAIDRPVATSSLEPMASPDRWTPQEYKTTKQDSADPIASFLEASEPDKKSSNMQLRPVVRTSSGPNAPSPAISAAEGPHAFARPPMASRRPQKAQDVAEKPGKVLANGGASNNSATSAALSRPRSGFMHRSRQLISRSAGRVLRRRASAIGAAPAHAPSDERPVPRAASPTSPPVPPGPAQRSRRVAARARDMVMRKPAASGGASPQDAPSRNAPRTRASSPASARQGRSVNVSETKEISSREKQPRQSAVQAQRRPVEANKTQMRQRDATSPPVPLSVDGEGEPKSKVSPSPSTERGTGGEVPAGVAQRSYGVVARARGLVFRKPAPMGAPQVRASTEQGDRAKSSPPAQAMYPKANEASPKGKQRQSAAQAQRRPVEANKAQMRRRDATSPPVPLSVDGEGVPKSKVSPSPSTERGTGGEVASAQLQRAALPQSRPKSIARAIVGRVRRMPLGRAGRLEYPRNSARRIGPDTAAQATRSGQAAESLHHVSAAKSQADSISRQPVEMHETPRPVKQAGAQPLARAALRRHARAAGDVARRPGPARRKTAEVPIRRSTRSLSQRRTSLALPGAASAGRGDVVSSANGKERHEDGMDLLRFLEMGQQGKADGAGFPLVARGQKSPSEGASVNGRQRHESPLHLAAPHKSKVNGVAQRKQSSKPAQPSSAPKQDRAEPPAIESDDGDAIRRVTIGGHRAPGGAPEPSRKKRREFEPEEIEFLASKVYSYIKRRLAVERERHGRPGFPLWP